MAYSNNPNLPRARAIALQLLLRKDMPLQVVANRCGVHRSTIWRWKRKWHALNAHVQLSNDNRPNRPVEPTFRWAACTWRIPTQPAVPRTHPAALPDELVSLICRVRDSLRRCAEAVWDH
jgi:hypothetical protein